MLKKIRVELPAIVLIIIFFLAIGFLFYFFMNKKPVPYTDQIIINCEP